MYGNQGWNGGAAGLMGVGLSGGGVGGLTSGNEFRPFPSRGLNRPASLGAGRPAAFTEGKLFLGGLDSTTTKESLVAYCARWGAITDAVVMEGRGFGFVTFESPLSAQAFLEQRNHTIDGKSVEAKAAVPKGVGSGSNLTKKLFVGGTGELTDEDFREYFSNYGVIQDAVIVRKQDGTSRGFGFVTFADEMSVEKCLVVQHELKGRKVDLRRAVPREQMATQQTFGLGSSMSGMRAGYGISSYGLDMGMSAGYGMSGFGLSNMGSLAYGGYGRSPGARAGDRFRPY